MAPAVRVAIDVKARRPGAAGQPLEIFRMSGPALMEGAEQCGPG